MGQSGVIRMEPPELVSVHKEDFRECLPSSRHSRAIKQAVFVSREQPCQKLSQPSIHLGHQSAVRMQLLLFSFLNSEPNSC